MSWTTWKTWVAVAIILAMGTVLTQISPDPARILSEPFTEAAQMGQTVPLRSGQLTVKEIRLAKRIQSEQTVGKTVGYWLIADISFSPNQKAQPIPYFVLQTADGREFSGTQPIRSTCKQIPPGFQESCQVVLEIAGDATTGATLVIRPEPISSGDKEVRIPTGLPENPPVSESETLQPMEAIAR